LWQRADYSLSGSIRKNTILQFRHAAAEADDAPFAINRILQLDSAHFGISTHHDMACAYSVNIFMLPLSACGHSGISPATPYFPEMAPFMQAE